MRNVLYSDSHNPILRVWEENSNSFLTPSSELKSKLVSFKT